MPEITLSALLALSHLILRTNFCSGYYFFPLFQGRGSKRSGDLSKTKIQKNDRDVHRRLETDISTTRFYDFSVTIILKRIELSENRNEVVFHHESGVCSETQQN